MVNQVFAIPPVIRQLYSTTLATSPYHMHISYATQYINDFIIAIFALWNLDFFRSFHSSICLYSNLHYQHVLLLEYAIGVTVYLLFLIFLTYIIHENTEKNSTEIWKFNYHKKQ